MPKMTIYIYKLILKNRIDVNFKEFSEAREFINRYKTQEYQWAQFRQ